MKWVTLLLRQDPALNWTWVIYLNGQALLLAPIWRPWQNVELCRGAAEVEARKVGVLISEVRVWANSCATSIPWEVGIPVALVDTAEGA